MGIGIELKTNSSEKIRPSVTIKEIDKNTKEYSIEDYDYIFELQDDILIPKEDNHVDIPHEDIDISNNNNNNELKKIIKGIIIKFVNSPYLRIYHKLSNGTKGELIKKNNKSDINDEDDTESEPGKINLYKTKFDILRNQIQNNEFSLKEEKDKIELKKLSVALVQNKVYCWSSQFGMIFNDIDLIFGGEQLKSIMRKQIEILAMSNDDIQIKVNKINEFLIEIYNKIEND